MGFKAFGLKGEDFAVHDVPPSRFCSYYLNTCRDARIWAWGVQVINDGESHGNRVETKMDSYMATRFIVRLRRTALEGCMEF